MNRDLLALRDQEGRPVHLDLMALVVKWVMLVQEESLAYQAQWVLLEILVQQDLLELLDREESRDPEDHRDHQVKWVNKVPLDLGDRLVHQAHKAHVV